MYPEDGPVANTHDPEQERYASTSTDTANDGICARIYQVLLDVKYAEQNQVRTRELPKANVVCLDGITIYLCCAPPLRSPI